MNRALFPEDKNMLYEMKNILTSETIYFKHFISCLRFSKMNPCSYIVENMKTGRKYWIHGINAQTYELEVYNGITKKNSRTTRSGNIYHHSMD